VILVRHAMPAADASVPYDEWTLTPAARAAAAALLVPRGVRMLCSTERKAVETAQAIGGALVLDARVGETRRPHEWRDDFRSLARAYVAGTRHPGWEAHADVVARFDAAIREHRPAVVVTHGQAMTLWLHSVGAIKDPVAFWSALTFPDAVRLDGGASAARVTRIGLR
jgi:broad specificity phosphatase PhoE